MHSGVSCFKETVQAKSNWYFPFKFSLLLLLWTDLGKFESSKRTECQALKERTNLSEVLCDIIEVHVEDWKPNVQPHKIVFTYFILTKSEINVVKCLLRWNNCGSC